MNFDNFKERCCKQVQDPSLVLTSLIKTSSNTNRYGYTLVYAVDALYWGSYINGQWVWGLDAKTPDMDKIYQARFFNADWELLIWRDADHTLHGRTITDTNLKCDEDYIEKFARFLPIKAEEDDYFDEFGKIASWTNPAYNLCTTGGGRMTIVPDGDGVVIRDYIAEDETGIYRIIASRCVEVSRWKAQ